MFHFSLVFTIVVIIWFEIEHKNKTESHAKKPTLQSYYSDRKNLSQKRFFDPQFEPFNQLKIQIHELIE